jgi:hypothetical protein
MLALWYRISSITWIVQNGKAELTVAQYICILNVAFFLIYLKTFCLDRDVF